MAWASGDFGLFGSSSNTDDNGSGRRLTAFRGRTSSSGNTEENFANNHSASNASDADKPATSLGPSPRTSLSMIYSTLFTYGIVFSIVSFLWCFGYLWWRFKINRRYYAQARMSQNDVEGFQKISAEGRKAKFRPLPGAFVFPSLFMLAANFFLTRLIFSSVFIVAYNGPDQCGAECKVPALALLTLISLYLMTALALLLHFSFTYRKQAWQPAIPADTPNGVEDPMYRLISRIRVRICRSGRKFTIMDRSRGEWVHDDDEVVEPDRTERLLARPFHIFRSKGSDALDALRLTWFPRASGNSFVGVSYDLLALTVQLTVAALNGYGQTLNPQDSKAPAVILTVLTAQFSAALYIFSLGPSADRIDNALTGCQFFVEGCQTLTLFMVQSAETEERAVALMFTAFLLGLTAIFLPLVEKVYDALIIQVSACLRGEFSLTGFCFAIVALAMAVPSAIAAFLGWEDGGQTSDLSSILDEGNNAVEMTVSDNLANGTEVFDNLTGLASDLAGGMSDLASDLRWIQNPMPEHHRAAVALQKRMREKFNWSLSPTKSPSKSTAFKPKPELRRMRSEPAIRISGSTDAGCVQSPAFDKKKMLKRMKTTPSFAVISHSEDSTPAADQSARQQPFTAIVPEHHRAAVALQRRVREKFNWSWSPTKGRSSSPTKAKRVMSEPHEHVAPVTIDRPGFTWLEHELDQDIVVDVDVEVRSHVELESPPIKAVKPLTDPPSSSASLETMTMASRTSRALAALPPSLPPAGAPTHQFAFEALSATSPPGPSAQQSASVALAHSTTTAHSHASDTALTTRPKVRSTPRPATDGQPRAPARPWKDMSV